MTATPALSQWQAHLDLDFLPVGDKTRLIPNKRYGPLSVQRAFYPEGPVCHAYLLHPPGGVAGGDSLTLNVMNQPQAKSLLTTPGATKFYHNHQHSALVEQIFSVKPDSTLEYLPQENIYFPGSWVDMRTHLSLEGNAQAIVWEKHCFGRPANHEAFDCGAFKGQLRVEIDAEPILLETQRIDPDEIARASGLRNHPVMGTLIAVSEQLSDELVETCRVLHPVAGVAALTRPDERVLVARYIGDSTRHLNDFFVALWQQLRPVVCARSACQPRIWST